MSGGVLSMWFMSGRLCPRNFLGVPKFDLKFTGLQVAKLLTSVMI